MAACRKCGGKRDTGFILDEGYGTRTPAQWCSGAPRKSIWMGLKMSGVTKRPVESMRCTRCGFLENYAR